MLRWLVKTLKNMDMPYENWKKSNKNQAKTYICT